MNFCLNKISTYMIYIMEKSYTEVISDNKITKNINKSQHYQELKQRTEAGSKSWQDFHKMYVP